VTTPAGARFGHGMAIDVVAAGCGAVAHAASIPACSVSRSVCQDKTLQLLIEKDFRCLDEGVPEDQSDTFENPLTAHLSCS
jgi:hypothetical protein